MTTFKYTQNFHTHTLFCDGTNTVEEMVLSAIAHGFDTLGFSGHSAMGMDTGWTMENEKTQLYIDEVLKIKEKYSNQINVLCGLEFDFYSLPLTHSFDYLIGSCHYIKVDGELVECDTSAEEQKANIDKYFGGDGIAFAKKYYETMCRAESFGKFDIIGHFDVITKHCDKFGMFNTDDEKYRKYALEALHTLKNFDGVFEINTGAIPRGYMNRAYPEPFILKEMNKLGCKIILTSDCHYANYLDCYYKEALELAIQCGYKSICVWENGKFNEKGIV